MTQQTLDDETIAVLRRIERKAEVMKIDASARRQPSVAADANEIGILARIALRKAGVYA